MCVCVIVCVRVFIYLDLYTYIFHEWDSLNAHMNGSPKESASFESPPSTGSKLPGTAGLVVVVGSAP